MAQGTCFNRAALLDRGHAFSQGTPSAHGSLPPTTPLPRTPLPRSNAIADVGCISRHLRTPNARDAPSKEQLVPYVRLVAMRLTGLNNVRAGQAEGLRKGKEVCLIGHTCVKQK